MLDARVLDVPVEGGLKLGAVVSLDALDTEGQLLQHVIDELDRRLLVQALVDPQHAQPGAVVDGGELVSW